jgi:hypothetical protein
MTPTILSMAHFLLIYDRAAGKLLREEQFETEADALAARFAAEKDYGVLPDVEVLAISAASEEELKRSHGRYFLTSEELGERLVGAER